MGPNKKTLAFSNEFLSLPTEVNHDGVKVAQFTDIGLKSLSTSLHNSQILDSAKVLGNNIYSYKDNIQGGKMFVQEMINITGTSLSVFLHNSEGMLCPKIKAFISEHIVRLQAELDMRYDRNFDHDFFTANTFYSKYVWNVERIPIEFPEMVYLRTALNMYYQIGIEEVVEYYHAISDRIIVPSTPTLINASKSNGQLVACFLQNVGDNKESINKYHYNMNEILFEDGGASVSYSNLRKSGIKGKGDASGPLPLITRDNFSTIYVHRGGGRRGALCAYLRCCHIDFEEYIGYTDRNRTIYNSAPDIFTAIWTSWLFWERVRSDGEWTMFCPVHASGLNDVYGEEFTRRYKEYEVDPNIPNKYKNTVKAIDLFSHICQMHLISGHIFVCFGDACNAKSNQRNLGYIKQSNLCTEIVEYTDPETIASCILCTNNLKMYFLDGKIHWESVRKYTRMSINFLNRMIDVNHYPLDKEDKKGIINVNNLRNRPTGLGMMGFTDLLYLLRLPFESEAAAEINILLSACRYFNAMIESIQAAIYDGPYETYKGSPLSEGKFQFDLWAEEAKSKGVVRDDTPVDPLLFDQPEVNLYDNQGNVIFVIKPTWDSLREAVVTYGVRNSLLIAIPPNASTAEINGVYENTEPPQFNIGTKRNQEKDYLKINTYLYDDLEKLNLLIPEVIDYITEKKGSVQGLYKYVSDTFSYNEPKLQEIEKLYKTAYEILPSVHIKYNAARGRYVCQSQSLNLYLSKPNEDDEDKCTLKYIEKIGKCILLAEELGVKTIYYVNTESVAKNEKAINIILKSTEEDNKKREMFYNRIRATKVSPPEESIIDKLPKACQIGCTNCN